MLGEHKLRSALKDAARIREPRGGGHALVVLGCQRSGTNSLIRCFERDPDAKVFQERSPLNRVHNRRAIRDSRRYSLRLGLLEQVAARLARQRYPLSVLKPLVESQRGPEILAAMPAARIVWIFREPLDVAESNTRTFGAEVHRRNLEPIVAGDPDNWRSERAGEDVRATVAAHYRPDMDPLDGGALFWWARNRLLFDLGLHSEPRVLPLRYERFAFEPERVLAELYEFVGARFPGPAIAADITQGYRGRGSGGRLSPEIEALCEALWERLLGLDPIGGRESAQR